MHIITNPLKLLKILAETNAMLLKKGDTIYLQQTNLEQVPVKECIKDLLVAHLLIVPIPEYKTPDVIQYRITNTGLSFLASKLHVEFLEDWYTVTNCLVSSILSDEV